MYYAILHDGDPGPNHLDNICAQEHCDFQLKAELVEGAIKITTTYPYQLEFTARHRQRPPWLVTMWNGPQHQATMAVHPNNFDDWVHEGETVLVELEFLTHILTDAG